MRDRRPHYEEDAERWPDGDDEQYYTHRDFSGIALRALGWETTPDEDTEWTGQETRTGRALVVMVGDDERHRVDPEDLTPLPREQFCGECGQIGCCHDGYDREPPPFDGE